MKKAPASIKKIESKIPYKRRWGNQFSKAYTDEEIETIADELLAWMEVEPKNLWFKDFLIEKRINGSRVGEFCKANEYFAWVMTLCKDIQESRMFKAGTSKKTNPAMFIIGLKNNHGWKDKTEMVLPTGSKSTLEVKFV